MDNFKQLKTSLAHLTPLIEDWFYQRQVSHYSLQIRIEQEGDMWSRGERIVILVPVTLLLLGSLLLFLTFPQITHIPRFSFTSEQRTEEGFLAWTRKQQQRRERVARICASDLGLKGSLRADTMQYSFLFNPDHNLLGCLQPKVRLTTFALIS